MVYAYWLGGLGLLFWTLERIWPRRPIPFFRAGLFSDLAYIAFNSHFLGVAIAYALAAAAPAFSHLIDLSWWRRNLALGVMSDAPFWLQFVVFLLVFDFLQWCVHNLLHRVPWLWTFHMVHHSSVDLDWIGNWRFHWGEILVYRTLLYLPGAFFGFRGDVLFWAGVVNTAVGHFAHANLSWRIGWLRYVVNSPEMHIWHHNHPDCGPVNRNFGLTLSIWDWTFGTAHLPDADPPRLGFAGIESYPEQLPGQWLAPFRSAK